jgi:hypothetical protein
MAKFGHDSADIEGSRGQKRAKRKIDFTQSLQLPVLVQSLGILPHTCLAN